MANFNTPYLIEREGQMEFFDNYSIPYNDDDSVLIDNTDGVYNGNIFEFKLNISNINRTLFQAIKYLSKMRVKGESVPATILLVDLNATTVYVYKSMDYFNDIHKIYNGAASKDNDGFVAGTYNMKLNYSDMDQSAQIKKILKGKKVYPYEMYIPIDIDENCIVGWAERYYREKPTASKGDFLGDDTGTAVKVTGEIRDPRHFKGLINSYTGKSNEKFKYLMDCLNDRLSKKDLGAFYTPIPYAKKAAELVQMAIERVPKGNDYIILDRCAGTGNLEAALIGLTDKNGDDLIEHCIVSTYEYYEYKVLSERIGDLVREIIPPSEANVVYENGKVANADALSKDFINNPLIKQYVDNPKCTIILFENPPYRDITAQDKTAIKVKSYVYEQFVANGSDNASHRDLSNLFIWSGFQYYMRQDTDSYIVFSPVKYFKSLDLIEATFETGFAFNRKFFHATDSVISCVYWKNIPNSFKSGVLKTFDCDDTNLKACPDITINKVKDTFVPYNDKRTFANDNITRVTVNNGDGAESFKTVHKNAICNDNIIGYLRATSFNLNANSRCLTRTITYDALTQSYGFYLRKDNYKDKLPLWVAKLYPQDNWYDKDVYFTTSDGGDAYTKNNEFLKSCLIYTCLSNQNKCISFDGSDGRRYQNELCFDDSRKEKPLAIQDLENYTKMKETALDDEEKQLINVWKRIQKEISKTANYNPNFNYGIYQIAKELNTSHTVGTGKSKKIVYDYPDLNGLLDTLRVMLKAYYKSHITKKMFEYELLK